MGNRASSVHLRKGRVSCKVELKEINPAQAKKILAERRYEAQRTLRVNLPAAADTLMRWASQRPCPITLH